MPPLDMPPDVYFSGRLETQSVGVTSVFDQVSWFKSVRTRLQNLASLPENWNGYGSPQIAGEAISESLRIINELAKLGMPEPEIFPISGGGVQMEWQNQGAELEIEIMPDRSISYLLVGDNNEMFDRQIRKNENIAEFTPVTCWFLSSNCSIEDFKKKYAQSY